jgi:hypothetical protein
MPIFARNMWLPNTNSCSTVRLNVVIENLYLLLEPSMTERLTAKHKSAKRAFMLRSAHVTKLEFHRLIPDVLDDLCRTYRYRECKQFL